MAISEYIPTLIKQSEELGVIWTNAEEGKAKFPTNGWTADQFMILKLIAEMKELQKKVKSHREY